MQRAPGSEQRLRIVIADDHSSVRRGLGHLLEGERGLEIVAEAAEVNGALRRVRVHRPDVLILDLSMQGRSTIDAIPEIRATSPATRIVVLTMHNEPAYARQALKAGALGYVLKEAADSELVEAILRAASGESYVSPRLGVQVAAAPAQRPPDGSVSYAASDSSAQTS